MICFNQKLCYISDSMLSYFNNSENRSIAVENYFRMSVHISVTASRTIGTTIGEKLSGPIVIR